MATTPRLTVDRTGVKHRLVWVGIGVALVGTLLVGLGLTITPMWTWIVGAVLMAGGGICAMAGGVLRDVELREHHMPLDEIKQIEAEALPASSSGAPLELEAGDTDPAVEQGPRLDQLGALMLLGLTLWLMSAPYVLSFEFTPGAEKAIYHAFGLGIITGLVGLRSLMVAPTKVGSGIVAIATAIFLVETLVRDGIANGDRVLFLVTGALVLLAAVLAATPRKQDA